MSDDALAVNQGGRSAAGGQLVPPRGRSRVAAAYALLAVALLLAELDGGTRAGYGALVVIAVVVLSFYGTGRQLALGLVGAAAVFVLPMVTIADARSGTDIQRNLVWIVVLGVVGPWMHHVVVASREREQRMRVLLDSLPDTFVMVIDADYRFVYVSGAYLADIGWQTCGLEGRTVHETLLPDDEPIWLESWTAALRGERVHFETRGSRTGRSVVVDMGPLFGAHGQVTGAMAVSHDVSERAETAAALAVERTRAQAAFEAAPFGVAVIDPATQTWLSVNEGLARMLGHPVDELIGQRVLDFSHPDDVGVGAASIEELAAVPGVQTIEKRYLRADGSVLWGRVSARIRQVDGESPLVITHTEDITEQRVAEEALAQSETRARAIVSALHEGIVVRDHDNKVIEWNDAVLEMLGLGVEQLKGAEPPPRGWHLLSEDGRPMRRADHPDSLVAADGRPRIGVQLGVACPGRETRWFRVNAVPLTGIDGLDGVITSFVEETERLAAEREVTLARDRFSALVEHSSDLVTVLVPGEGRYRYASPAWDRLLGWDPSLVAVEGLAERIHPDDLPIVIDTMLDVMGTAEKTRDVLMRVMHLDGTYRYLDTTFTNLTHNEAVGGIVVNSNDVTEQMLAAAELAQMAMHDGLTGLPNRRLVLDRIGQALEEQRREGTSVAVLFLDLDDFKRVNDEHGHAAGDQLLVTLGQRLSASVRSMDTVGRMGGDEFVIVAVLRELEGAASIARHVEEALEEPIRLGPKVLVQMAASIGIVVSRPDRPRTADELLADADSAMYEVKRRRRHLRAVN